MVKTDVQRTIICDIDDTISFTQSRNFEEAKPNSDLISKLNGLFDKGWKIVYCTARGTLSCASRADAEEKYKDAILHWFKRNNVKYTRLSFMKELGVYYIDDKAIRPDEFLNLEIQTFKNGLSGAIVERHGNKVYKTDPNSLNVAYWYNVVKTFIPTPKIYSVVGDTIEMQYIENTNQVNISDIEHVIDIFKEIKEHVEFDVYIERIKGHLSIYNPDYFNCVITLLEKIENFCNNQKSFCHGDFTLDNMLWNDGLYLIDPIYSKDNYSSWLLDVSKLLQSCRRFNNFKIKNHFENKYSDILPYLKVLELTHWIRMRKYTSDKKFVDDNITIVLNEIKDIKNVFE